MSKRCFLCGLRQSVMAFDDKTFKNCYLKIMYRRRKGFKYQEIQLTKDSMDNLGYHNNCLRKVTCLNRKYVDDFNRFVKMDLNKQGFNRYVERKDKKAFKSKIKTEEVHIEEEMTSGNPWNMCDTYPRNDNEYLSAAFAENIVERHSHTPMTPRVATYSGSGYGSFVSESKPLHDHENEFDIFSKSIAAQLKALPLVGAVQLQLNIQQLITDYRLKILLGENYPAQTVREKHNEVPEKEHCIGNEASQKEHHMVNEVPEKEQSIVNDVPEIEQIYILNDLPEKEQNIFNPTF